ncbi:hypothetical protein GCM10010211_80940 [Streptomyces albospinus]|uniref:Uncharacterized protein n=2 Tax=Streptomyces albospinus TaxID=285515 RepID=A0ABQ2VNK1_9ACTN|nr:hypothetical protein GCM10010211_80940 [Streptomyces albospinus]
MRLCATGRPVRRIWTVELRPQPGGPVMLCPHCPPASGALHSEAAARPAVVAHLAGHARRDALPVHLRTCQCQERGCPWHPRHRGCSGRIALVLTRESGGRLWRLADACTACAQATAHSAVVPEAASGPALELPRRCESRQKKRRNRGTAPSPVVRIREMLSYLAAALPPEVVADARLLAVQCALRATGSGQLMLPVGLLRGMRMAQQQGPWQALEKAGWLVRLPRPHPPTDICRIAAQLLDATVLTQAPGRAGRTQAAHAALRLTSHPALRELSASEQLVGLTLATHSCPNTIKGVIEAERIGRVCAVPPDGLAATLDRLVTAQAARSWSYDLGSEDITWSLGHVLADWSNHPLPHHDVPSG